MAHIAAADSLSIYIHIPFCRSRCSYCAFNTYTGITALIPEYVEAVCSELRLYGAVLGNPPVHTIYFGGGTPSTLPVELVQQILDTAHQCFHLDEQLEVSMEVNPTGFAEVDYLAGIYAAGVNRLSVGAQSAQRTELRLFNRQHSWADVDGTVKRARKSGFDSVSLDLIYGAPGQKLVTWQDTLNQALRLQPDHISLYSLGIEPDTPMDDWISTGKVAELSQDETADMYDAARMVLAQAGYVHYELSNWAIPGHECRHNLQYWQRRPYIGIGAGASGFVDETRYSVVLSPQTYIARMRTAVNSSEEWLSPAVDAFTLERLTTEQAWSETMFLQLRLLEAGVSRTEFRAIFGCQVEEIYGGVLKDLVQQGLLVCKEDNIILAKSAYLISNQVFVNFV
jgi:oxygen-independent coproporphyrinogen-3 oxidase